VPVNPVQIISAVRSRLARLAALGTIVYFVVPAATAILLAVFLPAIGEVSWERFGYVLDPAVAEATRAGLACVGVATMLGAAVAAWRSYRKANDFIAAAERLDERLHAHEQIVTLATLAGPETPEPLKEHRSPLFPLLWRNVMNVLSGVNPRDEFRLDVRKPLKRSSLYAAGLAVVLGFAMLALVEPPTPLQKAAMRLNQIADEIEHNATGPGDLALARAVRKAAQDLVNPNLPPKEKLKRLETAMREVQKEEQQKSTAGNSGGSKSAGAGGATSTNAAGNRKGEGQGQGPGQGKGPGKSGKASGNGGKEKGGQKESIKLQNELSKAEALVQTQEESQKKSGTKPSPEEKTGNAPMPGNNPNLQGGQKKNGKGEIPKPSEQGEKKSPGSAARGQSAKKSSTSLGNTHLGEFPAPVRYQRFYKPGEKGAALDIKDARYVTFRIPPATPSGGEGKTVIDTGRPTATTPYTNAPLAQARENLPPEERQLVPPRYRDLIR
jgi:hypothetical protein